MEQEHETRRGVTAVALCSDEGASCLIPHIIAELREPCPCCRPGLTLTGQTRDGRPVTIAVKKGVLEVEGISQEELDELVNRRCLIRSTDQANSPP